MPNRTATISLIAERLAALGVFALGTVWYVGDAVTVNGRAAYANAGGYGKFPDRPFATLAHAITEAVAGDVIVVLPQHAETITSPITVNKAGLQIIGMGSGRSRPAFTCNAAIDCIAITADNVRISGFYFPASTAASVTSRIDAGALDCTIDNCLFLCGANDTHTITVPNAGDRVRIRDCEALITANGPASFINIESSATFGGRIENIWSDGGDETNKWDLAMIYFPAASIDFHLKNCITLHGPLLLATTANLHIQNPDGTMTVRRGSDTLPQTADEALFRIDGYIEVLELSGEVTTVIQTQANNTKLKHNPSGTGSDVDLCAVLDITADAVGTVYSIVGVLATALKSTSLWLQVPADRIPAPGLLLGPGDIELDCAASNTGNVRWQMTYRPVGGGGSVAIV